MIQSFFTSPMLLEVAQSSYVWQEHLREIITVALLSMVPTFEGRYAATLGITAMGLPAPLAFAIGVIFSTLPVPLILLLLRPVLDWFYTLPIKPVQKFAAWLERRAARKHENMHSDEKTSGLMGWLRRHVSSETMELIALYIFVALPLPGTGAWTGSAIATLFELPRFKSGLVILLGNITACLIMTLGTTGVLTLLF